MVDRFDLADLSIRVIGAPMAGGPSTPSLAAAVTNAGGLGFLAGGMLSATQLADAILATRRLASGAIGVNLFVPHHIEAMHSNSGRLRRRWRRRPKTITPCSANRVMTTMTGSRSLTW